jgi:hypothetical protein
MEEKKFLIGYNLKKLFENEDNEEVFLDEFQEIAILSSPFDKEKTLNIFISKNKKKLEDNKINKNKLLIEEYRDIGFNEMINIFKGGHH